MEEVLEKLESSVVITPNTDKSDFEGLYKNWGRLGNQEERRKEVLTVQKNNRSTKHDKVRGILELVNAVEMKNVFNNSVSYKSYYRPRIYVAGFNPASLNYNDVLMLSEWMVEKPQDFNENWLLVPCPKGTRVLVVASKGATKLYNRHGLFVHQCRTALPGGRPFQQKTRKFSCCVLDCVYDKKKSTLYVLDLLAWNNQPMTNGEAEFRHFWLQSQFQEIPQLNTINKQNDLNFVMLPKIPCSKESFNNFMSIYPAFENNVPQLDGLLFYHKNAQYVANETPLVGWLFPYMVPEVIDKDITVHPSFMQEKPADYTNQADYIAAFEEQQRIRRKKQFNRKFNKDDNNMQCENEESVESMERDEGEEQKNENVEPDERREQKIENMEPDEGEVQKAENMKADGREAQKTDNMELESQNIENMEPDEREAQKTDNMDPDTQKIGNTEPDKHEEHKDNNTVVA